MEKIQINNSVKNDCFSNQKNNFEFEDFHKLFSRKYFDLLHYYLRVKNENLFYLPAGYSKY